MRPRSARKRAAERVRLIAFELSVSLLAGIALAAAVLGSNAQTADAQRALASCSAFPEYGLAAEANARSLTSMQWAPYRRPETGWEFYAPLVAAEIATECPPQSRGFAAALATWQKLRQRDADGEFTAEDFVGLKAAMNSPRTVIRERGAGCPAPPPPSLLSTATLVESYGGKTIQLRDEALDSYRAMIAAIRKEAPELVQGDAFKIFSAFRSPDYDAARCARDNNCDGIRRARCSPHRTGMVMDIYLGQAPGYGPDSTADPNRRFIAQGGAYRWMVRNAGRFGFVSYPFEPWHWEWTRKGV